MFLHPSPSYVSSSHSPLLCLFPFVFVLLPLSNESRFHLRLTISSSVSNSSFFLATNQRPYGEKLVKPPPIAPVTRPLHRDDSLLLCSATTLSSSAPRWLSYPLLRDASLHLLLHAPSRRLLVTAPLFCDVSLLLCSLTPPLLVFSATAPLFLCSVTPPLRVCSSPRLLCDGYSPLLLSCVMATEETN